MLAEINKHFLRKLIKKHICWEEFISAKTQQHFPSLQEFGEGKVGHMKSSETMWQDAR